MVLKSGNCISANCGVFQDFSEVSGDNKDVTEALIYIFLEKNRIKIVGRTKKNNQNFVIIYQSDVGVMFRALWNAVKYNNNRLLQILGRSWRFLFV